MYFLELGVDLKAPCQPGTFQAYNGDCTQYLHCLWGKYEVFQCAPGLHWNNVSRNIPLGFLFKRFAYIFGKCFCFSPGEENLRLATKCSL